MEHDPFTEISLGHTLIDWSDGTLTPDRITKILCGSDPWAYWDLPQYGGMSPWEIERKVLFDARRPNWGDVSVHGKPYYQHMLLLAKLLFPKAHITPTIHDTFAFFCTAIGKANRKGLHLIGSQNAGKSFGTCLLQFVTMYIDPPYTQSFVANVFKNASDSQVWGTVKELWQALCEAHPNISGMGFLDSSALFPWGKLYADRYLEFVPNLPKGGVIRLQAVKHEGMFRGTKSYGDDISRGVIILNVDEINLLDNYSFIGMMDNLASQPSYIGLSSQNYKDPQDLGGQVTEPTGLFGGPRNIDELNVESSIWWHSRKSSITLRFDGHKSPNILLNKDIYPKLFTLENLQTQLENGGEQSPSYFSQVRSFPIKGIENNSVLSSAKISSSRHKDSFFALQRITTGVSFVDPAFGGRDDAVWGCLYFGVGTVTDGEGEQITQDLVVFKDYFHRLKLVKGAYFNEYWTDRMTRAGINLNDIVDGAEVSYEDQIAIQTKELNLSHKIPDINTGYDFSMRPDIVSSMNRYIGFGANAFDYNNKPEGVYLQSIKQNSEDCCKNRCTELAMLAADLFLTKQVRGGDFIETAVMQLSRTLLETVNKKFVAEGKKEYKARWSNVSPDHRDVLMGLAGMAVRKGLARDVVGAGKSNERSAWDIISSRQIGKAKIGKRF